jgi:predicted metal-dependent peptidase
MNQSDRIDQARIAVILASPFFGSLLMRLSMERDDSKKTFSTNGRRIAYNEDYCAALSDSELRGVLVHEVAHCAQGHLWRIGGREHDRWNRATDYSINNFLTKFIAEESEAARLAGTTYVIPWTLPKNVLLDPQFADLCSEEIYNCLPREKDKETRGQGEGETGSGGASSPSPPISLSPCPPSCGEFEQPGKDEGEGPPDSLEAEWQVAVTQAATIAKMRGELPASLKRMIGDLLEPKVPWRQVLREFIRIHSKDDYCWSRPNRRYLAQGIILPSLHSERMGRIAFGVDTSGSIDADMLAEFGSEIQATLDECRPEAMEVIYCDAAVNGSREFLPGDAVKLEMLGGGGTRFAPVFEHIGKMDEPPVCCIYLTDGHGTFPAKEPDYPVLWAWRNRHSVNPPHFPFGQVVAVK